MLTIKIIWWLWNQMFQYVYIKALSLRNNATFCLDISSFKSYKLHQYDLEYFNIDKNYCLKSGIPLYERLRSNNKYINFLLVQLKWICKRLNNNHSVEKQFNFDLWMTNIKNWYIEWYFQTEKYFIDYEDEIRKDFSFTIPPSSKNQETIDLIDNGNAVSIHIRRWDYVSNTSTNSYHGVCSLDYYHKAIKIITEKVNNPVFFFFSDDMDWVKENLNMVDESYYVDWNNAESNYEDMRLMSHCKHNVIANSSFSWRWAWLNSNPDKIVIAPSKWFENHKMNDVDLIPDKRVKI